MCRLQHNVPFAAPAIPNEEQEVYDLEDFRGDYETTPPRQDPPELDEVYDLEDMVEVPTEDSEPKNPGTPGIPFPETLSQESGWPLKSC